MTALNKLPFAGAPFKRSLTKRHEPLVWENMLGTVRARGHTKEVKYFDYDYAAAHAHAGTFTHYEDLRVARVTYSYQDWPSKGRLALFGVRKVQP